MTSVDPGLADGRVGRCPDGGYCHGQTLVVGSAPCDPGICLRVLTCGPLSGVFPGDRWPAFLASAVGHAEADHAALADVWAACDALDADAACIRAALKSYPLAADTAARLLECAARTVRAAVTGEGNEDGQQDPAVAG